MFKKALIPLLALVTTSANAFQFPVELIEYVGETRVVAFVPEHDLAQAGTWAPFDSTPPLSISDALSLVKTQIASEPKLAGARLQTIDLAPIPNHDKQWHYVAKLATAHGDHHEDHFLLVLMNGQIISAMGEPDSIK
ncbi:MAG: hypothetical protein H6981_14025 [Gammaproteobacteria bacterium]|nr:hypothetical protein [Gammaproteobacteria bacterium]MCP5137902.1 hypothetical protein [Gammaproteobacteria bacterium]